MYSHTKYIRTWKIDPDIFNLSYFSSYSIPALSIFVYMKWPGIIDTL